METPKLPWTMEYDEPESDADFYDANGVFFLSIRTRRATAELILRAVNGEGKLRAAGERSLDWLASYPGGCAESAYDQMRAALKED